MELLIKKLADSSYINQINFEDEQVLYSDLTTKAINSLITGLSFKIEIALSNMLALDLGNWTEVEDQSEYVTQVSIYINHSALLFAFWLSNPLNFQFFCDSFVM